MWGYGHPWGMMGYGAGWPMLFGGIFWLILLAVIIFAIVRFTRHAGPAAREPGASGLAILDERYARGEIGRDEYLQMRADLTGKPAA